MKAHGSGSSVTLATPDVSGVNARHLYTSSEREMTGSPLGGEKRRFRKITQTVLPVTLFAINQCSEQANFIFVFGALNCDS